MVFYAQFLFKSYTEHSLYMWIGKPHAYFTQWKMYVIENEKKIKGELYRLVYLYKLVLCCNSVKSGQIGKIYV